MKPGTMRGMFVLLAAAAALVLLLAAAARAQAPQQETQTQPDSGEATPQQRERQTAPDAPAISFIDSPTPTCYQPAGKTSNACFIEWNYIQVFASTSQYIISTTVQIDGRMRAYYSGFFQTSITVPSDIHNPGFKVACGPPGSNPIPELGKSYSFTLRARETGGLGAANYGSVTCPVGPRQVFLPIAVKR